MKTVASDKFEVANWAEAQGAMARLASAEGSRREIQADIESEIASVHEGYHDRLTSAKAAIDGLQKALAKFAKKHKKEFRAREDGGDTRSFEHAGVVMGFRKTPARVEIKKIEQATQWLRQKFPLFIRTKYEPNREALLEELKRPESTLRDRLAGHGIAIDSDDKFFCEVKEQK